MTDPAKVHGDLNKLATAMNNAIDALAQIEFQDVPDLSALSLEDALIAYFNFQDMYKRLDALRKVVYHRKDLMDKVVIPKILEDGGVQDGIKIRINENQGINFRVATKTSARVVDKEKLYAWLRERGDGDIITETVNAGTLASMLKHLLLDEGIEAPEGTVELKTYNGVGMTKYKPKPE